MNRKEAIQPITIDLIKELRLSGHRAEAREMLNTFIEKGKEQKKQLQREIEARDRMVKRLIDNKLNSQPDNGGEK